MNTCFYCHFIANLLSFNCTGITIHVGEQFLFRQVTYSYFDEKCMFFSLFGAKKVQNVH